MEAFDLTEEIRSPRDFSELQRFRSEKTFCDVCVKCQEKLIYCHKIVLASQSNYFYKILTEATVNTHEIKLPGDHTCFITETVIDFLYSGSILIDATNYVEIFKIQQLLNIVGLSEELYKCLRQFIIPKNIKHLISSYKYFKNIEKLKDLFEHVFLYSFDEIKSGLALVGLDFLNVISLLGRSELNIKSESELHRFLVDWLVVNKAKLSKSDLEHALRLVRWKELDLQYVTSLYFEGSKFDDLEKMMSYEAICHISKKKKKGKEDSFARNNQYNRSIFSLASYDGSHLWELLRADVVEEEWFDLGECPINNTEKIKCIFHKGWLYALGNNGDMIRYTLYVKKWEECRRSPYSFTRSSVMVDTGGDIMVCGGDHATGRAVVKYNSGIDTWFNCASMPNYLDRFSGALINDKVYIVGQSTSEDIMIQFYTCLTGQWEVFEDSGIGTFDVPVSAAQDSGMLYILGGSAPNEQNSDESSILFRFNPSFDNATILHPLPHCCINAQLVSVQGSIYSIGGINKGDILDLIQRYNPQEDRWDTLDWKFPFHTKRYCICTH